MERPVGVLDLHVVSLAQGQERVVEGDPGLDFLPLEVLGLKLLDRRYYLEVPNLLVALEVLAGEGVTRLRLRPVLVGLDQDRLYPQGYLVQLLADVALHSLVCDHLVQDLRGQEVLRLEPALPLLQRLAGSGESDVRSGLAGVDDGGEVVGDGAENVGMRLEEGHAALDAGVHLDDVRGGEDEFGDGELQADDVLDVVEVLVDLRELHLAVVQELSPRSEVLVVHGAVLHRCHASDGGQDGVVQLRPFDCRPFLIEFHFVQAASQELRLLLG